MKLFIKTSILLIILTFAFAVCVYATDTVANTTNEVATTNIADDENVTVDDLDLEPNLLDEEEFEDIDTEDDEDELDNQNLVTSNPTLQTVVTTTTNDNVLSLTNILSIIIIVIGIILIFLGIAILIRCKS